MSPRSSLGVVLAVAGVLLLTGCAPAVGTAFGYGAGDGSGTISGEPVEYGHDAVIGIPLDNRTADPVELLTVTPLHSMNVLFGASSVAPVLRERDGDWLSFGVNRPSDTPTLVQEWRQRKPAAGYRIAGHEKNLQALLEISVRNPARPARVVGVTIRYRQDGRIVMETTHETACFFPKHRESVCSLP